MGAEVIHGLQSYFTFRLNGNLLAVNIGHLVRILEMKEITAVPDSPESFRGIIHFMGDIIPVFDGRLKFGFPVRQPVRETCILILVFEQNGIPVTSAIIIDSVEKVVVIDPDLIQTDCSQINVIRSEYLMGYAEINDEPVFILNPENLFSDEEVKLIIPVE
jgi:purine-binding chemotaxis protein CheW